MTPQSYAETPPGPERRAEAEDVLNIAILAGKKKLSELKNEPCALQDILKCEEKSLNAFF